MLVPILIERTVSVVLEFYYSSRALAVVLQQIFFNETFCTFISMRKFNPIISTFRVSLSVLLKADLVCRFWLSFPHLSPIMKWMFRNTCFSLKFSSLTHSSALSHSRFVCYVACVCSRKHLNLYVLQGKRIHNLGGSPSWIVITFFTCCIVTLFSATQNGSSGKIWKPKQ